MKRAGKKVKAWESARAKLKVKFYAMGITSCEARFPHNCWQSNGLSFAHAKKRRNLKPHELGEVALLCIEAHNAVESLPEAEMTKVIRGIIANRELTQNAMID